MKIFNVANVLLHVACFVMCLLLLNAGFANDTFMVVSLLFVMGAIVFNLIQELKEMRS